MLEMCLKCSNSNIQPTLEFKHTAFTCSNTPHVTYWSKQSADDQLSVVVLTLHFNNPADWSHSSFCF